MSDMTSVRVMSKHKNNGKGADVCFALACYNPRADISYLCSEHYRQAMDEIKKAEVIITEQLKKLAGLEGIA